VPGNRVEMEVDARLENIPKIIDFVTGWMRTLKLDDTIFAVATAVDEASTNIIKHAYSGTGGLIFITCELQSDELVVTLQDKGKPYDHYSVPRPDLNSDLENRKIGGLGIHLMRKLMDNVRYNSNIEKGNTLIMIKKLNGKHS
jgi:serine/threonine-protein kinase RsbW